MTDRPAVAALLAGFLLVVPGSAAGGDPGPEGVAPSPEDIRPLLIGSEVPEAAVTTLEGDRIGLREITSRPTLLIFYRGGW